MICILYIHLLKATENSIFQCNMVFIFLFLFRFAVGQLSQGYVLYTKRTQHLKLILFPNKITKAIEFSSFLSVSFLVATISFFVTKLSIKFPMLNCFISNLIRRYDFFFLCIVIFKCYSHSTIFSYFFPLHIELSDKYIIGLLHRKKWHVVS